MSCNKQFVIVAGYGWSGSSVISDLLKEFDNCYEMGDEFRLLKDPYGVLDLKYNLVDNWELLNSDNAIKDFVWFVDHLNYKREKHALKDGLGYSKLLGSSFMTATHNFLEEIIDYRYKGKWFFTDWKKSKIEYFIQRLKKKLGIKKDEYMYFAKPTPEKFNMAVNKYLNEAFGNVKQDFIVLDQGLSPNNFFFVNCLDNAKMIIVDRDPRDIYADLIKDKVFLGEERDVYKFISLFKILRENKNEIKEAENVLTVQFEKIVKSYEAEVLRVLEFLNVNINEHRNKKVYFDPNRSCKNIGIYKIYLTKEEIEEIETQLSEYIIES